MQRTLPPYRSILVIKPGAVGDLLQMTPVLRALRTCCPGAKITMLVGGATTASLFKNDPLVGETLIFDSRGEHRSAAALARLWRSLHARRFDLVLNFQRSNLKAWFLCSAAFPCRVLVYHKTDDPAVHAVRNYLDTLSPLCADRDDMTLKLYLDDAARAFARDLFALQGLAGSTVVALNPGATHAVNRWPAERFAELADLLSERGGVRTIIIGGPDDVALADEIVARSRSKPLSLAGKTSLLQLGAVLERCGTAVSGDTGPLHLATAVGTRVVALFGAADPRRTGPVGHGHRVIQAPGVACVPCRSRSCSNREHLACMTGITARAVADAVAGVLRSTPSSGNV